MYNDDDFNWNHGLSLGSTGNFKVTRPFQIPHRHSNKVVSYAEVLNTHEQLRAVCSFPPETSRKSRENSYVNSHLNPSVVLGSVCVLAHT